MRDTDAPEAPAPVALLSELAHRVDRLRPDHRRPERFHEEKSEIRFQLLQLASRIR